MTAQVAARDDAERTGRYAARATVADVSLDIDVLELVVDDGAGRTRLLARGRKAVLAHVAHHEPTVRNGLDRRQVQGHALAGWLTGELLDELHMAPGRRRQLVRVVVAVAGPVEPIRGQLVPLLARHLARFTSDTHGCVRIEAGSRARLRRLPTTEGIDQASHQLRQSAGRRIGGLG